LAPQLEALELVLELALVPEQGLAQDQAPRQAVLGRFQAVLALDQAQG
jgi:hypothetical protein